jgi:succinate dehydrogenase / fumarate reductase cytochrome b subunit
MSSLVNSSIGKKIMMGLAGLFLCINDGGEAYGIAVKFMTTNILIKIMEVFLFGGFILHIFYGILIQIQNWVARPVRYKNTNHSQTSFFSKYMIHTGAIIGAFLALHFMNFYFVKLGWVNMPAGAKDRHDFYTMVMNLFKNPVYSWLYIGFILFLGFHLNHALQSAFQTLGWEHTKYTPIINTIGLIYSVGITVGFSIIPLAILYFK